MKFRQQWGTDLYLWWCNSVNVAQSLNEMFGE